MKNLSVILGVAAAQPYYIQGQAQRPILINRLQLQQLLDNDSYAQTVAPVHHQYMRPNEIFLQQLESAYAEAKNDKKLENLEVDPTSIFSEIHTLVST